MQLPDEAIEYNYQGLMVPHQEEWTAVAELRRKHFLEPGRLRAFLPHLLQVRSQIAAERELQQVPADLQPLDAGFIDLPQKTLDNHRRKGEASDLGRVMTTAARLRSPGFILKATTSTTTPSPICWSCCRTPASIRNCVKNVGE